MVHRHAVGVEPELSQTPASRPRPLGSRLGLLAIVLLVALPIRLFVAHRAVMVSRDTAQFIWYAQELADDPIAAMRERPQHPLYPVLVLAAHRMAQPLVLAIAGRGADQVRVWEDAAIAVGLLGGLLVIVATYLLTERLFDRRVAIVAALLAATMAEFCQLSADGLTDMPHLAVFLLAMWAAIGGITDRRVGRLFLAGVLAGTAYLLRPEGAEPAVVAAGVLLIWPRQWRLRKRLLGATAVAAGALLVASPYMIVTGKLIQKKSIGRLLFIKDDAGQSVRTPADAAPEGQRWLARGVRPGEAAVSGGLRPRLTTGAPVGAPGPGGIRGSPASEAGFIGSFNNPVEIARAFGPIIENYARSFRVTYLLPVIAWLVRRRQLPGETTGRRFVGAVAMLHLVILVALIVQFDYWKLFSLRHVMVLTGLTLPFAAAGLVILLESPYIDRHGIVAVVLGFGLVAPTLPWLLEARHRDEAHYLSTAHWIRQQPPRKARVMTSRHRIAFYADAVYVNAPEGADARQVLDRARATAPDWLVFDERRVVRETPAFFDDLERLPLAPGEMLKRAPDQVRKTARDTRRVIIYYYRAPPAGGAPATMPAATEWSDQE